MRLPLWLTRDDGRACDGRPCDDGRPHHLSEPDHPSLVETTRGKDKIVIGAARPISGVLSVYEECPGPHIQDVGREVNAEEAYK